MTMTPHPPDPHDGTEPTAPDGPEPSARGTRTVPALPSAVVLRRARSRFLPRTGALPGRAPDPRAVERHRGWRVVVPAVLSALIASAGLLGGQLVHHGPHTGAPGTAAGPPREALRPYYTQKIAWKSCGSGAQCGGLTVPLDYAQPGGGSIRLALVRRPATEPGERMGSLLFNPGGPGASGVEAVRDGADAYFTPRLRSRYDLVGFDPRGVGGSAPVRCGVPATDEAAAIDATPDDPAETARLIADNKSLGASCKAVSGVRRLAHVSSRETARDMDVLRAVLGDARLHYMGVSYGTYLGTLYAEQFPDRVGRLVLDAAVDPRADALDALRGQAAGFQRALDAFLVDCTTRADCPLGTAPAGAHERLAGLLARLDRTPLPVGEAGAIDKDVALQAVSEALYNKEAWPLLRTALQAALDGNGTDLLELISIDESGGLMQAYMAISCLDLPPALTSAEQVRAQLPSFRQASPVFGEWLAWGGLGCADWPVRPVGTPHEVRAPGAPPILVVGTTRDPATPYADAQALVEQLDSGVLLTRDGDGHSGYAMGSRCIDDAVDTYLVEGRPPAQGSRCT